VTLPESPGTESRRSSVVAACFSTLPRRLLVLGGFVVLGWFGLAMISASHASADPTSASSPAGALGLPQLIPAGQPATVTDPLATAKPDPVTQAVTKLVAPVTSALSAPPKPNPATQPLSDAASKLFSGLAEAGAALSQHPAGSTAFDPSLLLPGLKDLLGGGHAVSTPPATRHPAPTGSHTASIPTSATPRVLHADLSGQPSSASSSRPADESLSATPAPASPPHGQLAGLGIPAPLPALPPVGPDTALVAGSGLTATSSSGSGASSGSGYGTADVYRHDAPLLGTAESARSRPVRNSATEPPVSPD
jgi:hypothetical protein